MPQQLNLVRRDAPFEHREGRTALYRFFAADGSLLYVGISDQPAVRFRSHAGKSEWWTLAVGRTIEWFDDRKDAAVEELRAIREEGPRYNSVGTQRFIELCRRRYQEWLEAQAQLPVVLIKPEPVDALYLASLTLAEFDRYAVARIEYSRARMAEWRLTRATQIATEYEAGTSVEGIAAELRVSAATVYEVMRAARPDPKKPGRKKRTREQSPEAELVSEPFQDPA